MLPAKHRLKSRKDFNDLFRNGRTFSSDVLLMKIAAVDKGAPTRFGFGASLKFSKKAAERNKAKRWMREAVRSKIEKIVPGWQAVIFISPQYPKEKLNFEIIQENVEKLLKKAKIRKDS
jgi:ribonuclease P protein component